ncbi:hypothetical protein MITS9509_01182 [Synechococcus sp. MIT S9509]|uniref:hypothetical protein n=1 Tax=unclassified Synechococcus TaxID=2626047 RepID=UPI0007BB6EEE|nr:MULTISPECIES: hypothetical protein [unclassified Synechococcus]KZR87332.1 hypothetical protein MITS9504_00748 [Synechococcus sp. MIT S9504]KZR92733.1 hypothetical protein MITS9509_01182 [Synechococcus sp. MIT S9509]
MPHFVTFDVVPHPEKDSFGSFEPRQAKLQDVSTNDDLIGRKGLSWGEVCDVGASLKQADELTGSFDPREVKPVEIGQRPDPEIGGLEAPGGGIVLDTTPPQMPMHQGAMNSIWGKDEAGNFRDAAGNTSERYRLGPGATFEDMSETFEPVPGMHSFAGSLSPVPGDSSTTGPLCRSYLEPQLGWSELCDVGAS